jgi:hypothetical protein
MRHRVRAALSGCSRAVRFGAPQHCPTLRPPLGGIYISKSFDIGTGRPAATFRTYLGAGCSTASRSAPSPFPAESPMSFNTPDRSPQRSPVLPRVCDRLSRAGVYLLPVFYVGFVAMLFLIWHAPRGVFWLPAAAGALACAMSFWSLVFYSASGAVSAPDKPAMPQPQTPCSTTRTVPLRFVQMTTRACSHACASADGTQTRFTVSCFHARCASVAPTQNPRRANTRAPQEPSAQRPHEPTQAST